jgi:hypothetical protein
VNVRWRGQVAAEFLLCVALLATALFAPLVEGTSAASYLARHVANWFHGLYEVLALS